MSELKAVHAFDVYEAYTKTGDDDAAQVYLKSEADKVITHHKYKRCLAMKKMCQQAQYKYSILSEFESSQISPDPKSFKSYDSKSRFYLRWRKRWIAIAEKFKEAK